MKIGIIVGSINPHRGGESTITRTIIDEINNNPNVNDDEYVFLYISDKSNHYSTLINGYKFICINNWCGISSLLLNGFIDSFGGGSNRFFTLDKIAKKEQIDMFYFAAPLFARTSLPYIFTVWDLGHRTMLYSPEVSKEDWGYREKMYSTMLPRATYIITGNNQGKSELLQYYKLDANRIKIVPFPLSISCFCEETKPDFIDDNPFYFYPAQFWPHKNHICILDALVILREKYNLSPKFYFTGSDKGNRTYIESQISKKHLEDQVKITGYISDSELNYLYTHAEAMVFASLMGPNNLPPLEAIYHKCPVIISDIPGHIEQMGNAALFFDGYRPEELAEKIKDILLDKKIVNQLLLNERDLIKSMEDYNYFSEVARLFQNMKCEIKRWKND